MSKGNMLLGMARGKVGDLVFTRRNGEQITRPRVRVVNNPKTEGQQIQRMIFASVIWAYQRMKAVCDHSFEGVRYGADSQAKFMSENLKALRAYYPTSADPTKYGELEPYQTKSFILPNKEGEIGTGLVVALGTIPEVSPFPAIGGIAGWGKAVTLEQGEDFTIAKMLEAMGAEKGDQISVLGIDYDGIFRRTRYVIRADATTAELNAVWDGTGQAAAFDAEKTVVDRIKLEEDGSTHATIDPTNFYCACIVISRKGDGDKWLRSNAKMWYLGDEPAQYQADYALPYWQFTGTDIVTTDPRFLNNADV